MWEAWLGAYASADWRRALATSIVRALLLGEEAVLIHDRRLVLLLPGKPLLEIRRRHAAGLAQNGFR